MGIKLFVRDGVWTKGRGCGCKAAAVVWHLQAQDFMKKLQCFDPLNDVSQKIHSPWDQALK